MSDASYEQIEDQFRRAIRLCSAVKPTRMIDLVHELRGKVGPYVRLSKEDYDALRSEVSSLQARVDAASLNERRHRKALDEATALLKEFYGKDNHGHLSASTTRLFERTGRWLHGDPPGASLDAARREKEENFDETRSDKYSEVREP